MIIAASLMQLLSVIFATMSRFHSYIKSAQSIIDTYKGEQPFPYHLKQFFSANKKYGSKDRKLVSECCYAWLRCSHLFDKNCTAENIVKSLFLCSDKANTILENLDPVLSGQAGLSHTEKLNLLALDTAAVFPFLNDVGGIEKKEFALSFLQQPSLFLRIRPGKEKIVLDKLSKAFDDFIVSGNCVELPNATKLDDIMQLNKEVVIQDKSSQQVFILPSFVSFEAATLDVWDCCAASGGKSILLYDSLKSRTRLTVSDIRSSILHNCRQRLQQAGINIHHAFVADISKPLSNEMLTGFDIIICDAPCTGSGTWSRTPEQLAYFDGAKINAFSTLQQSIAHNVIAHLKEGGMFIYITCSVFAAENEAVVASLQKTSGLLLLHSEYINGYNQHADTMFVAIFRK